MLHPLFKQLLRKYKGFLVLSIVVVLLSAALNAGAGYSLSYFFDVFEVGKGEQMHRLWQIGGFSLLIWSLNLLFLYLSSITEAKFQQLLKNAFRQQVIEHISQKTYEEFSQENSGTYLSWLTNDAKEINERSFVPFLSLFSTIFAVLASFVALYLLDVWISIVAIGFFVLNMLVPQLVTPLVERDAQALTIAQDKTTGQMKDTLMGFGVFYTTNRLLRMIPLITKASTHLEERQFTYNKTQALAQTLTVLVSLLAQVGLLAFAVLRAVQGSAPMGAALAVANLAGGFYNNIGGMIKSWITLKASKPIWNKYAEAEQTSTDLPKKEIPQVKNIRVADVHFSYPDSDKVFSFDHIDFTFPKNYAISGASGSGKSTLMKLISGLYRQFDGHIYLNQVDIKNLKQSSVAKDVVYMDQQAYIFSGSLRDNISLYDNKVSDEAIIDVLKTAGLENFLQELPQGLDTKMKENGKNISGGQRQRLALARTLLLKPHFIIIDEGTSQLDEKTAKGIEEILLSLEDVSIIVVSHHFNLETSAYDQVVHI